MARWSQDNRSGGYIIIPTGEWVPYPI